MNKTTKASEERILASVPFKPFSVLTITNRRIIGKGYIPLGPNRFDGEILISNVTNLTYSPGASFFAVPSLTIKYKQGRKLLQVKIRFPGFMARTTGYSPEEIYKLILSQIK